MSRETDRQMINLYREVSTALMDGLHSAVEMLGGVGAALQLGSPARQVWEIGMQDLSEQVRAIDGRLTEIHGLQVENVRQSMHGAADD